MQNPVNPIAHLKRSVRRFQMNVAGRTPDRICEDEVDRPANTLRIADYQRAQLCLEGIPDRLSHKEEDYLMSALEMGIFPPLVKYEANAWAGNREAQKSGIPRAESR